MEEQHHEAYLETMFPTSEEMPFGFALEWAKIGKRITRASWNGPGQWVRLFNPYSDKEFGFMEKGGAPFDSGTPMPFLAIHTTHNQFVPWLASQTDMLEDDWMVLEDEA
jgi:hypothetical protein